MSKAFVLMTALPPTKGHWRLLQFSQQLSDHTIAIVCTQPDEPFAYERWEALNNASLGSLVTVRWFNKTIEQNPEAPGFWEMWHQILKDNGFHEGDLIVASEHYGKTLAEKVGGRFFPYDLEREMFYCKATDIRELPRLYFDEILPEFQHNLRKTVTIFGAESTGKTTLSRSLASEVDGHWTFEYARPYLESLDDNTITTQAMTDIWQGQKALQWHSYNDFYDKPFIIQDTDLFSTVGYWDFWDMNTPAALVKDALLLKSDLYIITKSNIPFEEDPLRYGGDKRESDDQFWINLCVKHGLNFVVLDSPNHLRRLMESRKIVERLFDRHAFPLRQYERQHNS